MPRDTTSLNQWTCSVCLSNIDRAAEQFWRCPCCDQAIHQACRDEVCKKCNSKCPSCRFSWCGADDKQLREILARNAFSENDARDSIVRELQQTIENALERHPADECMSFVVEILQHLKEVGVVTLSGLPPWAGVWLSLGDPPEISLKSIEAMVATSCDGVQSALALIDATRRQIIASTTRIELHRQVLTMALTLQLMSIRVTPVPRYVTEMMEQASSVGAPVRLAAPIPVTDGIYIIVSFV